MKQYFYARDAERVGPVGLDELRRAGLRPATLVWYEGLPDWKPAGELPELSDLFAAQAPPPMPSSGERAYAPAEVRPAPAPRREVYDHLGGPPPKTYLLESILATVLCCIPLGIVGIVNASKVESRYYAGDVEQARHYSREARKWVKYSVITAAALVGLSLLINIFSIVATGVF